MTTINPVASFGKDHWSVFAYIETCCVEGKDGVGKLSMGRMRANENTHPLLAVNATVAKWQPAWGTRLFGFFAAEQGSPERAALQLSSHDDWDCLDDLAAAGFVEILSMTNGFVRMTPAGLKVSAALREHKATGGVFAHFTWPGAAQPASEVANV